MSDQRAFDETTGAHSQHPALNRADGRGGRARLCHGVSGLRAAALPGAERRGQHPAELTRRRGLPRSLSKSARARSAKTLGEIGF